MLIEANAKTIVKHLKEGKVVAIPTETVFGLAVTFDNKNAINKMNEIKKRDQNKIYTMMIHNKDDISKYADVVDCAKKIIDKYMPGEITIILPKNKYFKNNYFKNSKTIGIRIPNHKLMQDVLKESGPLLVSSANISGEAACITTNDVIKNLNVDIIVNQDSDNKPPSTIVLVTNKVEILRQGDIKIKMC